MAITPFEQANFNLMNLADGTVDLFDSTPKDVSIQQKDSNGDIYIKNIQNRGKFQEKVWDDVGAALGQFDRTFYVDSENGDDTNDGSSSNPFATIQKACNSVPVGGRGYIHLLSDVDLTTDVNIESKVIHIFLIGYQFSPQAYLNNNANGIYGFVGSDLGVLIFQGGTINLPAKVNSSTGYGHAGLLKGGFSGKTLMVLSLVYGVKVNDQGDFYILEAKNGTISFTMGDSTLNSSAGRSWSDLIQYITRDTNGIPRNIISNVTL